MELNSDIVGLVKLHTSSVTSPCRTTQLNLGQILQREIGLARGVSVEQLSSPTASVSSARAREASESNRSTEGNRGNAVGVGGKRKYRRHPKVNSTTPHVQARVDVIPTIHSPTTTPPTEHRRPT